MPPQVQRQCQATSPPKVAATAEPQIGQSGRRLPTNEDDFRLGAIDETDKLVFLIFCGESLASLGSLE